MTRPAGIFRPLVAVLGVSLVLNGPWSGPVPAEGAPVEGPAMGEPQRQGEELARALGCGACHAGLPPADDVRAVAPPFGEGGAPLPAEFVFTWLADPQPRRPELAPTRMPDFRLTEGERHDKSKLNDILRDHGAAT